VIAAHNHLKNYIQHPIFSSINKKYTDDTQMSIALIELLISGKDWNSLHIAEYFVAAFKRDPREGYAKRFYTFLSEINSGKELLDKIMTKSERNGAAMRAYPLGGLNNISQIKEWTKIQAEVTHQTEKAVISAQAIALISHFFIYKLGNKSQLLDFIVENTGYKWAGEWKQEVQIDAIQTTEAVLDIMISGKTLSQMLIDSVNLGGDVDTVASIVLAIGSITNLYVNDLPLHLYDQIENKEFGKDYLVQLDNEWKKFIQIQIENGRNIVSPKFRTIN
jgi:ADP-ribosyl-[dinitrogen reductase] hydrolase